MSQRILIIKHSALGDFIFSIGTMQEIKKRYPDAHFTLLTTKPFVKIAQQTGVFNEIIVDSRARFNLKEWFQICKKLLADGNFDLIFNIQLSKRVQKKYYTLARLFTKKPFHWGNSTGDGFDFIHVPSKMRFTWGKETHSFMPLPWVQSDLSFLKGEQKYFHLLPQKYVLLIPGCSPGHPYKRWPKEHYAELAKKLAKKGVSCVVLGTPAESEECNYITNHSPKTVNFLGKSSLLDVPALALKSIAVVGNDTGPTHMASLCQKPVIALFSQKTAQYAHDFPNVTNFIAPDIADISVNDVFNQLQKIIGVSNVSKT